MGVFHRPGPVFWFGVLLEEEEEAEKLRCSWLDVDDSREEDTCGCGAQWSGPPIPGSRRLCVRQMVAIMGYVFTLNSPMWWRREQNKCFHLLVQKASMGTSSPPCRESQKLIK